MRNSKHIHIYISAVLDEIKSKMHTTGKNRGETDKQHAQIQEGAEVAHEKDMMRSIHTTLAEVLHLLSEYNTKRADDANDAPLDKESDIDLMLTVPMNFDSSVLPAVAKHIHNAMVDEGCADWCRLVGLQDEATYLQLKAKELTSLRMAMMARVRPARTSRPQIVNTHTGVELQ